MLDLGDQEDREFSSLMKESGHGVEDWGLCMSLQTTASFLLRAAP
jgi:hypothetical protein